MWIVAAVVCGLFMGEWMRRRLNKVAYRVGASELAGPQTTSTDDLDETALPHPGPRWWIPLVLAATWGCVLWQIGGLPWSSVASITKILGWFAFSAIGLWLAGVDLDVRRLPDGGQLLLAMVALVFGVVLTWGHLARLVTAVAVALICGAGFLIIHAISRGSLGLGDVKLVMTCGWWLALDGVTAVFAGLALACLAGIVFSAVTRSREFAFGPWLIAGAVVAGLFI
ncbi:MAG: A24 family peptidase [Propionibacteriaceae bacterium]|nr:A24 family peptidase [Propionibacteriaceae bacterium]